MKMTLQPPTGSGYYWWTNGGENTPTILNVRRGYIDKKLYAENGEYSFTVSDSPVIIEEKDDEYDCGKVFTHEGKDYYYGTELWAGPIELPEINGEFVKPDSF